MAAPRLWSKLDSDTDVISPSIGVGGSLVATPTYTTAKFGNGMRLDQMNEGANFPTAANNINMDKGAIEYWAKMRSTTPGTSLNKYYWNFIDTDGIQLRSQQDGTDGRLLRVLINHADGSFNVYSTTQNWVVDELIHWAVAWDRGGTDIGDNKTVIIFRNGIEIGSSTTTWNESTGISTNLFIGGTAGSSPSIIIDNLKIYNLSKIDYSEREVEESSWFRGQMEEQTLHPVRRFIYDDVIETVRVQDFGVIGRTSDAITSGGATLTLINTDQYWNKFRTDPSNLRREAKLQIGLGFQGTIARSGIARSGITISNLIALAAGSTTRTAAFICGWGEWLDLFIGWADDPEFDGTLLTLPLRDKFANLLEIKVGSEESPVDYYSSSYNPADLAWDLLVTHGNLDSTATTDNTDIDYTSWATWKTACTAANLSLEAKPTGESIRELLELIRDLTNSYIHQGGDGLLRFSRFTETTVPGETYLFNRDRFNKERGLKVKMDSEKLLNSLEVYYDYDQGQETWAGSYIKANTISQSRYGTVPDTKDSTAVWHATLASATSYAEREVSVFAAPFEIASFETFLMGMTINIGDRIRITDTLYGYNETYFTVFKIENIDLNRGSVILTAFRSANINILGTTIDLMEYFTDILARAAWVTSAPPTAPTDCELWSRLESHADVGTPQIGTGGGVVGAPDYVPCKFDNGIRCHDDPEGCYFPTANNNINIDKGTIEFWVKLNFAMNEAIQHRYMFDFFKHWTAWDNSDPQGGIYLLYGYIARNFTLVVISEGITKINLYEFSMNWSVGDIKHFAVTWDRQGNDIGNSKTLMFKVDDVEVVSSTVTWNTDVVNPNLFVGCSRYHALPGNSIIDNLKTYDFCKTDFSDRNDEYGDILQAYSEDTIRTQGTHSLNIFAKATDSLNETLTRSPSPTIDLSDLDVIRFHVRASRTGSNFTIAIHDSGGTTTTHTVNILAADSWQLEEWTIVAVTNANKDDIDSIVITITNADANNVIYIDGIEAYSY